VTLIVLIAVISPAPAWAMPQRHVDRLRSDFPQHTFIEASDRDEIRRRLPEADVAFASYVDRDAFASATRLKWVQSPAVGVGRLMYPELLASAVILTSARGIRARSMAEHVIGVTIALARVLPATIRAQAAHRWAQEELETATRTLCGQRMGIVGKIWDFAQSDLFLACEGARQLRDGNPDDERRDNGSC
jgi:phosphoglycerate dehydrogenase-like enzyme